MKKIFLYLIFLFGTHECIFSQNQPYLKLQFSGRDLISQKNLGRCRVRINNLTKSCDTTISAVYESVNLIISGTNGIEEMDKNKADFILKQNFPNPFIESTNVNIYKAHSGPLTLVLSDELGRKLTEYHSNSDKGNLQFQISSPGNKILILTVSDDKNSSSIKLMSAGQRKAPYKIKYIGQAPDFEKRTLKSQETKQFVFDLSDQLEFTAYIPGYFNKTIVDSPFADTTYVFDMSVCKVPVVTTLPAINITQTTVTCSGNIGSDNENAVTDRGFFVWPLKGDSQYPIVAQADDAGSGNYSRDFSNLSPGSAYSIQAYATTVLGTSLGNVLRFQTLYAEYPSVADAEEAVKKAYFATIYRYREASMFSEEYYYVFNLIAGETQYINPEINYTDLNNFKFNASNTVITELYSELYLMIYKANEAQNRLVLMINNGHWSGADLQKLKHMSGEVLFLRGMAYSLLIRTFGEKLPTNPGYSPANMGVPIDTLYATGSLADQKRNTCGEVYGQIIRDLSMAETLLPDSWSEAEKGKATKASARGFLGEIYIYLADWTNASSVFERVINDGQHSLVDNFQENFDRFHFHNKESIFESECDNSVLGVYHGAYSYRLYAKQSWGKLKVPTLTIDKFKGKVILNNAALAAGLATKALATGALQKSYIDTLYKVSVPLIGTVFESKEAYLSYIDPLTDIPFYKPDGISFQPAVRNWLDAIISKDPRLYPTVYTPYVDNFYVFNLNNSCEKTLRAYDYSDYGQKKYIPNDIEVERAESCGFGNNGFMTMNFRILRLDDIYLYYAESEYNKGNIANAFEYLNKVVRRAYGKNGASSSEYDYPVSADFMTVLKKERFKEFCLEGKTMFDVRRWNDAVKEWGARGYTDGKNNALPIPTSEIYYNPGLSQNPGY